MPTRAERTGSRVVRRSTPAPLAVADLVARCLSDMRANVPGVVEGTDPECLHDFRVAVRRARTVLKLSRRVFDPATVTRRRDEAKVLAGLTSPLRDLDVLLAVLDRVRPELASVAAQDLSSLEADLRRRREEEHLRLVRATRSDLAREFMTDWTPELRDTAGRRRTVTAEELSRDCATRANRRVVARGLRVDPLSPAADLHALRKRCKELRYALEMFGPLHDRRAMSRAVADLKKLQDALGRFQDAEVQQAMVLGVLDDLGASGGVPAPTADAVLELASHLRGQQERARRDAAAAFARYVRRSSTAGLLIRPGAGPGT